MEAWTSNREKCNLETDRALELSVIKEYLSSCELPAYWKSKPDSPTIHCFFSVKNETRENAYCILYEFEPIKTVGQM